MDTNPRESRVHNWKKCGSSEIHQCLNCGIVIKSLDEKNANLEKCELLICARYCDYCEESIPLDELKFHSLEENDELYCDIKAYDDEQRKEYNKENSCL
jgi:hypothetical protein